MRKEELEKSISLLNEYIAQLDRVHDQQEEQQRQANATRPSYNYRSFYMTADDTANSHQWAEFENVYQIHNPRIIFSNTTRDVCAFAFLLCSLLIVLSTDITRLLLFLPDDPRV